MINKPEKNNIRGIWKIGWNIMAWFGIVAAILIMVGILMVKYYLPSYIKQSNAEMQRKRETNASHKMKYSFCEIENALKPDYIFDLYTHIYDSIKNTGEYDFVQDIPQGSITFWLTSNDSISVDLRYNFDCHCPLEANTFNCLIITINFENTTGSPTILEKYIYESEPKDRYPKIIASKR